MATNVAWIPYCMCCDTQLTEHEANYQPCPTCVEDKCEECGGE
jgi:hypothetical protein